MVRAVDHHVAAPGSISYRANFFFAFIYEFFFSWGLYLNCIIILSHYYAGEVTKVARILVDRQVYCLDTLKLNFPDCREVKTFGYDAGHHWFESKPRQMFLLHFAIILY